MSEFIEIKVTPPVHEGDLVRWGDSGEGRVVEVSATTIHVWTRGEAIQFALQSNGSYTHDQLELQRRIVRRRRGEAEA